MSGLVSQLPSMCEYRQHVSLWLHVMTDCYVADEVITSRAGVRVRVTNTDAEGRMIMADLLCEAKELVIARDQKVY